MTASPVLLGQSDRASLNQRKGMVLTRHDITHAGESELVEYHTFARKHVVRRTIDMTPLAQHQWFQTMRIPEPDHQRLGDLDYAGECAFAVPIDHFQSYDKRQHIDFGTV